MQENNSPFESIKHLTEYGAEFWKARELMPLLGYKTWQRFETAIKKAKESAKNTERVLEEEFLAAPLKTSEQGGAPKKDYILTREACY